MGFEVLPAMPGFQNGVFALWFRIPQESIDKARAAWNKALDLNTRFGIPIPPLTGIIPLSLFGGRTTHKLAQGPSSPVAGPTYTVTTWVGPIASSGSPLHLSSRPPITVNLSYNAWDPAAPTNQLIDPSFIGIDCRTSRAVFAFNFQYDQGVRANSIAGAQQFVGDDKSGITNTLFPVNDGGVFWIGTITRIIQDNAKDLWDVSPESFKAFIGTTGDVAGDSNYGSSYGYEITPDHWHQATLFITFKPLTAKAGGFHRGGATVDLWIDRNKVTGKKLSWYTVADDNVILTPAAYFVWAQPSFVPPDPVFIPDNGDGYQITIVTEGAVEPSYSFTPPIFQTHSINVPGDKNTTWRVEMAELEFYNGVVTDVNGDVSLPSGSSLVDLFVDQNGKPVSPGKRDSILKQTPWHRLHKSEHWISGTLTGQDTSQAFTIGEIKKYTPDPSLNGRQS